MSKTVVDLTNTGLVIGSLTVDWVKQISDGASVSLTSHALAERGNGIYIYSNPNVTEDSDFRIHETATPANSVVGVLSLADGDLALDSTVAKELTLSSHEASRSTMEATLVAEHDATQVLLTNGTYGLAALQVLVDAIDTSIELQARFNEIKGAGWTTETLAAIHTLIESLDIELDGLATATELTAVKVLAQQAATAATGNYYVESNQLVLKDTSDVEIARWDLTPTADNPTSKVRV